MKITQCIETFERDPLLGYILIGTEESVVEIRDDEPFPSDYWVNELKSVSFY